MDVSCLSARRYYTLGCYVDYEDVVWPLKLFLPPFFNEKLDRQQYSIEEKREGETAKYPGSLFVWVMRLK